MDHQPDLPVVVSSAKSTGHEWRFVLAETNVVAGCEYDVERRSRGYEVPEAARTLAERVATAAWQPAPIYIVDIGDVDGSMKVMELNPFSGADLYQCDARAVVASATRVAVRLHQSNP